MAQKSLHGKVTDNHGKGLASASVSIPQINKSTLTDSNGKFSFDNIEEEIIEIKCSLTGFNSLIHSVHMKNQKKELLFHLEPILASTDTSEMNIFPFSMIYMKEITLVGYESKSDIQQMPDIVGTNIYAGKKSALVVLENVQGNVVTNNMRQVLAKVPGIQVWESDGSGIQIGIAARGLSPMRSWEFNVRQNG